FTFLRFLFYATRTSAFTSLPYTTLFRSALGPGRRELARQEVVAGVPVLDVDHVARLAETSDLVREDQLCHVCRPFSARRRRVRQDRKSTRLNSSHVKSSYAVSCLKKTKN